MFQRPAEIEVAILMAGWCTAIFNMLSHIHFLIKTLLILVEKVSKAQGWQQIKD